MRTLATKGIEKLWLNFNYKLQSMLHIKTFPFSFIPSVHSLTTVHSCLARFLISIYSVFLFSRVLEIHRAVKWKSFYANYSWSSNSKWIYAWANEMDELGINRGLSPHFSPSRNLSNLENQQQNLFVHLPNHGFRMVSGIWYQILCGENVFDAFADKDRGGGWRQDDC